MSQSSCVLSTHDVAWDVGVTEPEVVRLNVYDLTRWRCVEAYNRRVLPLGGAGAFHVGIEVFRCEYQFGFRSEGTGVTKSKPGEDSNHHFRGSISLGRTRLTKAEVEVALRELAKEWRGHHYSTIRKNCVHFAHIAAQRLGVKPLPDWVDRLPRLAAGAFCNLDLVQCCNLDLVQCFSQGMVTLTPRAAETWCIKAI